MSRKRSISSSIGSNPLMEDLAAHGALPCLLYTWAIPHADDWGRLSGDARQFRLTVCPALQISAAEVDEALTLIAEVGLWQRYQVGDQQVISFPPDAWFRWQSYIGAEKRSNDRSRWPAPIDNSHHDPPPHTKEQRETPQNAENGRTSPQNAEEHRKTPLTVPYRTLPSSSLSDVAAAEITAREKNAAAAPVEIRRTLTILGKPPDDPLLIEAVRDKVSCYPQVDPVDTALEAMDWRSREGRPGDAVVDWRACMDRAAKLGLHLRVSEWEPPPPPDDEARRKAILLRERSDAQGRKQAEERQARRLRLAPPIEASA